ncbi:hypothetical protein A3Q34_00175 [Colwellia sp. PAMC 20917]|jgi:hypothetical protein|uniref:hypothetical protein n=1 Tax=Colwellia sp. MB3u-55 TaxID=2759810 RepID=UPI00087801D8|nr:hypothetical protein [Colwellia sp. MB3u-55]AOW75432.1 hypothetical protein A3Q34_00175 [Colwellia sp. PAMC 20917]MBA6252264.1 DUF1269 domain-containing protein [Colwellia sp. MB3u-55]
MKRIYFLAPDVKVTCELVNLFRADGISDSQMHLIANDKIDLSDLPKADALDDSDLYPAIKRGVIAGGTTGLLAGLAVITLPATGLALGGAAILGFTVAGASFGAWVSGMVGAGLSDQEKVACETAISNGEVLMMLDVPADHQIEVYHNKVASVCPLVEIRQTEITVPPL